MRSDKAILKRLENKALHYLSRYASTEARLREVLNRFAKRKMADEDGATLAPLIEKTIADCRLKGYVNDQIFAEQKIASLRRSGASRLQIQRKLYQRGLAPQQINDLLQAHDHENPHDTELEAALIYARKKRLGPYRKPKTGQSQMPEGWHQKHLASLVRAGYSLKIALAIMALDTPLEAEDALEKNREENQE